MIKEKVLYRAVCEITVREEIDEITLTLFELTDSALDIVPSIPPLKVIAPGAVIQVQEKLSLRALIRSRGDILLNLTHLMRKQIFNYIEEVKKK